MLDVFTITERTTKGDKAQNKANWTKVGTAFTNKDGSINVYLDALPVNGKLQIRERKEKEAGE